MTDAERAKHGASAARKRDVVRNEFFTDAELVRYVREVYGAGMADHVQRMLMDDPFSETGFVRSVRRSLTHEIERTMTRA